MLPTPTAGPLHGPPVRLLRPLPWATVHGGAHLNLYGSRTGGTAADNSSVAVVSGNSFIAFPHVTLSYGDVLSDGDCELKIVVYTAVPGSEDETKLDLARVVGVRPAR